MLGEHRLNVGKSCPYKPCVNVPMIVAPPGGLPAGRTDERLVANIDLAPTIAAIMGADTPSSVDGQSLLPLIDSPSGPWRDALLLEQWHSTPARRWAGSARPPTNSYGTTTATRSCTTSWPIPTS